MNAPPKTTIAPIELMILLHHYSTPASWKGPCSKNYYLEVVNQFYKDGILKGDCNITNNYAVTAKGMAWIYSILATPKPTLAYTYVDKEGRFLLDAKETDS